MSIPARTPRGLLLTAAVLALTAILGGCAGPSAAPLPTASVVPVSTTPPPPRAAFLGDSYTLGVGASDPSLRWSSRVAVSAGWEEINLAQVGTGYVSNGRTGLRNLSEMIPTVAGFNPDIVVVAGGQNDIAQDARDEAVAVGAFFQDLRAALPSARIIAVGPSYPLVYADAEVVNAAVRDAAQAVGADYVDLLNPPVLAPEYLIPGSVHVNDSGHAAIASRVEASLGL